MKKSILLERILLLLTVLLAAWQVAVGINDVDILPMIAYTVSFGVLLIASLLLIIMGLDILDSQIVVIVSTIIPLSLSLGLVWENFPNIRQLYLGFVIVGFLAIVGTRIKPAANNFPVVILSTVHGVAGMVIFLMPIVMVITGISHPAFILVAVGGALIGIGGLLLAFLKMGKPILSRSTIFAVLPAILFLMTFAFVLGFSLG